MQTLLVITPCGISVQSHVLHVLFRVPAHVGLTQQWSEAQVSSEARVDIKTGVINLSEPGHGHISITSYRKVSDSH